MIEFLARELGPWLWWLIGLVLLAAELLVPGVFLVWIGIAALIIGALSLALPTALWWSWEVQVVAFALLSVVSAVLGRRYFAAAHPVSDEPLLNRRLETLVGRTATLAEPIAEGRGRIRLDDTVWPVDGPDLPAGTRVRVTHAGGPRLTVEPA